MKNLCVCVGGGGGRGEHIMGFTTNSSYRKRQKVFLQCFLTFSKSLAYLLVYIPNPMGKLFGEDRRGGRV